MDLDNDREMTSVIYFNECDLIFNEAKLLTDMIHKKSFN